MENSSSNEEQIKTTGGMHAESKQPDTPEGYVISRDGLFRKQADIELGRSAHDEEDVFDLNSLKGIVGDRKEEGEKDQE